MDLIPATKSGSSSIIIICALIHISFSRFYQAIRFRREFAAQLRFDGWQADHKSAALAQFAFRRNRPIMRLDNAAGDRQSYATAPLSCRGRFARVEVVENIGKLFSRYARAGIRHGDQYIASFSLSLDMHLAPRIRILDSIAKNINQSLNQRSLVSLDGMKRFADGSYDLNILADSMRLNAFNRFRDHRLCRDWFEVLPNFRDVNRENPQPGQDQVDEIADVGLHPLEAQIGRASCRERV